MERAVISEIPFVIRNPIHHVAGVWDFCMRTVTPLRAGVISIHYLEEAVCQPVAVLCEEHDVVVYLVENVNACHGRFLLVRSCYETISVYRVTGVFGGMWDGDTPGCCGWVLEKPLAETEG